MSTLRTRYGIPGVISTLALIFAMTGGAFAAKYIITSPKQIKPSVLKKLKGKRGPAGRAGAAGAVGPVGAIGPIGPVGPAGTNGKDGAPGKDGTNGTSVTSSAEPTGSGNCSGLGGSKFTSASGTTFACNGKDGEDGEDGETGFTETLPSGKTETGVWVIGPEPAEPGAARAALSFAIPLSTELSESQVHYLNAAGQEVPASGPPVTSTACLGTAAAPTATPGNLCVYTGSAVSVGIRSNFIRTTAGVAGGGGASTSGASLLAFVQAEGAEAAGTWAVTAP